MKDRCRKGLLTALAVLTVLFGALAGCGGEENTAQSGDIGEQAGPSVRLEATPSSEAAPETEAVSPPEVTPEPVVLTGNECLDPVAYFGFREEEDSSPSVENKWVFYVSHQERDFLDGYVAAVEEANPNFAYVGMQEKDYAKVGDSYFRYYYFWYKAPGETFVPDSYKKGNWHYQLVQTNYLDGRTKLQFSWKEDAGIVMADNGARSPVQFSDGGGVPGGGSSGGSSSLGGSSSGGSSGRTDRPVSCPFCSDGTEPCSRCDGEGGKYTYGSVPNYSGKSDTGYATWEKCSKCRGRGTQDCSHCGGDEIL